MADYISREALKKEISESTEPFNTGCVFRAIDRQPAADVEPVRHGRWGTSKGGFWEVSQCTVCGEWTPTGGITPNYCPMCGAKMDLEGEK